MLKKGALSVLGVAILMASGGCSRERKTAKSSSAGAAQELRAHVTRIFGGALVPETSKGADRDTLIYKYGGGRIQLKATRQASGLRIQLRVVGVSLQTLAGTSMLQGTLEGEGTLTTSTSRDSLQGDITLRCVACTLGGTVLRLVPKALYGLPAGKESQLSLPRISLGKLRCKLHVVRGKLLFRNCESRSGDAAVALSGVVKLRDPLADSPLKARLQFKLSPQVKAKHPAWLAVLAGLRRVEKGGALVFSLRGNLSKPRLRPGFARRRPRRIPPNRSRPVPLPSKPQGPLPAGAIRRISPRRYAVDMSQILGRLMHPSSMPKRSVIVPRTEGGVPVGFELRRVPPVVSLAARSGLQSGDLLLSVNGKSLSTVDKALAVYMTLKGPGPWVLRLRRGGKIVTLTYLRQRPR